MFQAIQFSSQEDLVEVLQDLEEAAKVETEPTDVAVVAVAEVIPPAAETEAEEMAEMV